MNHEKILAVISFTANYAMPLPLNDDKKKLLFNAHGECFFADSGYPLPEKGSTSCYYVLSERADALSFYYRGGNNDKQFLRQYKLTIQDGNVFYLENSGKLLTFEKME